MIITDRLAIRPINENDAEFILEIVNTAGWLEFIGDRNIHTSEEASQYIQNLLKKENFYYNTFVLKATSEPMGIISFMKREDQAHWDIGFAILPQYTGRGFSYEAATAYLDHISAQQANELSKDLEHIIAITKSDNKKSIGLIEKLGFTFEETYTDVANQRISRYGKSIV